MTGSYGRVMKRVSKEIVDLNANASWLECMKVLIEMNWLLMLSQGLCSCHWRMNKVEGLWREALRRKDVSNEPRLRFAGVSVGKRWRLRLWLCISGTSLTLLCNVPMTVTRVPFPHGTHSSRVSSCFSSPSFHAQIFFSLVSPWWRTQKWRKGAWWHGDGCGTVAHLEYQV